MQSVDLNSLKLLVSSTTVREALVTPYRQGYQVKARWGHVEKSLRSQRDPIREFKSINSACKLLKEIGLQQVTVVL